MQTASKFGDLVQVTCSATFATAALTCTNLYLLTCTNLVSAFLSKHSRKTCSPFHDSSLPVLRSPSVAMLLAAVWWRTKICLLTIGGEGMPKKQLEAIQLFHIYTPTDLFIYLYIYNIITYLIDIKLEAIVGKAYLHVVSRFSGVQPGGANGCITGSTSKCVP